MPDLGFALLRRTGAGAFTFICEEPDWWSDVWPDSAVAVSPETLSDRFPFLSDFLVQCEAVWRSDETDRYPSGIWEEVGTSGREHVLQAIAIQKEGESLLLLEMTGSRGQDFRQVLQTGRENALDFARGLAERQLAEEALRRAREEAEASSRAKSDFIANVSQEIRTPLNGVLGLTELLLETESDPARRDSLSMVKTSADSLLEIVNDILDFSEIESGKLALVTESFDLSSEVERVMRSFRLKAEQKNLLLKLEPEPDLPRTLSGDIGRLRQILVNLISNAIKFTDAGSVTLRIQKEATKAGAIWLAFAVEDTGHGIPEDQLGRIFEAFSQADGEGPRRHGGTGLGLAISSRLVKMMQGRLWVNSSPGQGSTFRFTVRLGIEDQPPAAEDRSSMLDGVRALVVSDQGEADRLCGDLRSWGVEPSIAYDPHTAFLEMGLAHVSGEPFQLTILDTHLDSVEVFLEDVDRDDRLDPAHVIVLERRDRAALVQAAVEIGCLSADRGTESLKQVMIDGLGSSAPPATGEADAPHVLLVEDNAVNRRALKILLEKKGCVVETALNGIEAVEAVRRQTFDLVLMDVDMPGMDGFEATSRIRAFESGSGVSTSIVAMTGVPSADRARCLSAGMDDHLSKPLDGDDLDRVLRDFASTREPEIEVAALIDAEGLMDRVEGDLDLLATMIELFEEELDDLMHEIREAILLGDHQTLERKAHSLKGATGNFGEGPVYQILSRLERMGSRGDMEKTNDLLGDLEKMMPRMMAEAHAIVDKAG